MSVSRLAALVVPVCVCGWLYAQPPGGGGNPRPSVPEHECTDVNCVATGVDCASWGTECEIGYQEFAEMPPTDGKECSPAGPQLTCELVTAPSGNCVTLYSCWFQNENCTTNWFYGQPLYSNDCATFEF